MNILFTGYYGYKNTGDDAFVEVASWGAKTYWNNPKVRFLAKSNSLPNTEINSKGFPLFIPNTYRFQKQLLINKSDILIAAGGSTLVRKVPAMDPKSLAIRRKQKGGKIRIGGIGVSIGPFKSASDEESVKQYLKEFDFLALRDERSYEYASSLNLSYKPINAFDLAALLPDVYERTPNKCFREKKIIGISVCPYESLTGGAISVEARRNKRTVELLRLIQEKDDVHFRFFIINGHQGMGDFELTKRIIREASPESYEIFHYTNCVRNVWESIADCDFMISTRLHGAIFACFSNTPFMLNEYHRKCEDFLYDVGYESSYRLHNDDYDPNEKVKQITSILRNPMTYKAPTEVSKMKQLAQLNFTGISL